MPAQPVIFISYRRSDAAGHAHDYLSRRFGDERVFFDLSTIESGNIFPEKLRQGVDGCAVVLALIGPEWLDVLDTEGRRRLDDPADFVRQEIALALEQGKTVIPVLFDDTPVPPDSHLPEPLKPLAARDVLTLRGKTFEYNTQRRELVRLLVKVPGIPEAYLEAGDEKPEPQGARVSELVELRTRPLEQLTEAQRQTIEALQGQLGANKSQLQAFFQIIGGAKVPAEQQWARLNEIAAQFRELKAQVVTEPGDAPEIARLKQQASAALDAVRLDEADDLLSRMETAQDDLLEQQQSEIERQQLDRAATTARRGTVALTRLRYREAAKHFAAAAQRVPPTHGEQTLDYLQQEADALYCQGDEFGDNDALLDAADRWKELLDLRPRERVPLDWAMTQNNLGNALWKFGERESGTKRLEDAVAAYRAALEEYTRERLPLLWATTLTNLGNALWGLGERESGTARLEEAIVVYRAALEENPRERVPLQWATTQNNMGAALQVLGKREIGTAHLELLGDRDSGKAHLEEAVAAYQAALEEYTRERVPLLWATTQNNLGIALGGLGEQETGANGLRLLRRALAAFESALHVRTRRRLPLAWADTKHKLGNALSILGTRVANTDLLKRALVAFREALKERTRERVPVLWATTQIDLGDTLATLGERESGTTHLQKAVEAYRAALEETTREVAPVKWAITQTNLGNALRTLGERELGIDRATGTKRLEEALIVCNAALDVATREAYPAQWATIQHNIGYTLWKLGQGVYESDPESGTAHLNNAVDALTAALKVRTRKRLPLDWAATKQVLANALSSLGEKKTGTRHLKMALAGLNAVLEVWNGTDYPAEWAMTQNSLGYTLWILGKREHGTAHLTRALAAFQLALKVYTRQRFPFDWATTQINLGNAVWTLARREKNVTKLEKARLSIRAGAEVLLKADQEHYRAYFEDSLRKLDQEIAALTRDLSPR